MKSRAIQVFCIGILSLSGRLMASCGSPSGSYEVMSCKSTTGFREKHLATDIADAQRLTASGRARSTFLQPNSTNSSYIKDIVSSAGVARCQSPDMLVWECARNTAGVATCTSATVRLYFSKSPTSSKVSHLDSNGAATQYGTLGTCTFR